MLRKQQHAWLRLAGLVVLGAASAQQPPADEASRATALFAQRCSSCHGNDATGTDRGPSLSASRRLRARTESDLFTVIQKGTPGGMPAFALPDGDLKALASFVRGMNASAIDTQVPGDVAAGERFFFGKGQCATCHVVQGRGRNIGPDLSGVGRQSTLPEIVRKLKQPSA